MLKKLFNKITKRQSPNTNNPNWIDITAQEYEERLKNGLPMSDGLLYGPEDLDEMARYRLHKEKAFREWQRQPTDSEFDNILQDYIIEDWDGNRYLKSANEPIAISITSDGKAYPNYTDSNGQEHFTGITLGGPGTGGFFKEITPKLPSVLPAAGAALTASALPLLFSKLKGNALPALGNAAIKLLK